MVWQISRKADLNAHPGWTSSQIGSHTVASAFAILKPEIVAFEYSLTDIFDQYVLPSTLGVCAYGSKAACGTFHNLPEVTVSSTLSVLP